MTIPRRHDRSRVGLLGGSFNPAHGGHREISLMALKALSLDAVWWLVSPGNPLKDPDQYLPYEKRMAQARRVADHHRIVVSNFEQRRNLQYTVDTLEALRDLWPQMHFVWIMGADGLRDFHRWKDWKRIATMTPFAVFSRPGATEAAEGSTAADALAPFRLAAEDATRLAEAEPPAWVFLKTAHNPSSSTAIRSGQSRP
jgi:nicotinate-nucleotide adenylyltransferase